MHRKASGTHQHPVTIADNTKALGKQFYQLAGSGGERGACSESGSGGASALRPVLQYKYQYLYIFIYLFIYFKKIYIYNPAPGKKHDVSSSASSRSTPAGVERGGAVATNRKLSTS